MPVTLGGQDRLILDVDTATGLVGYDLLADGSIGTLRETGTLSGQLNFWQLPTRTAAILRAIM